jgi:hypothetical protein
MQYLDYMNGHDFGVGIDAVNGSIKGDAVIRTAPEEVSGAEGQKVLFDMMQVETTEELTEALGASAEVNVGMGLFNASAQFNFAQQASVNRYSLYLLVSVSVTNAFRQLRDVRLTPHDGSYFRNDQPLDNAEAHTFSDHLHPQQTLTVIFSRNHDTRSAGDASESREYVAQRLGES